ncbi:MAG: hypothetical protein J6U01_06025 [Clostridia bacterium]|nr:hypothetical protein [Clostridia bacterium]
MSGRREPMTGYRHICPICGKEFWGSSEWKYIKKKRIQGTSYTKVYYCSWKCIRIKEKANNSD